MDYPQRNTDSEEKIWIENADSGRSGLLPLTAVCRGGEISDDFLEDGNSIAE